MSVLRGVYCTCRCHRSGGMMKHVRACCTQCPYCNQNINEAYIDDHKAECPMNPEQDPPKADEDQIRDNERKADKMLRRYFYS